ncbi:MAG: hypothetical protein KDE31_01045, partial [Caldilineaceae bacterium]|nr:hypothetical protein [Caldilineaceae bacterium]
MIRFRSPYLASIPQIEISGRLLRQSRRFMIFLFVAAFCLLTIGLIQWPVGKNGPFFPLYWLHDRIFLPLRAYTFTIFFPTSIIWWSIISVILLLWTISKLADRSLILQPHMALLRFAIHQPRLHPLLLHFAEQFQRRGYQPELIRAVVERERALAGHYVGLAPDALADPVATKAFAQFTHLLVRLSLLSNSTLHDTLTAANLWYESLLRLLLFQSRAEQPAENLADQQGANQAAPLTLLAACVPPMIARVAAIANQRSPRKARDPVHQERSFSVARLALDLHLTFCSQPPMLKSATDSAPLVYIDPTEARRLLAQTVTNRRALLGVLRHQATLDERRSHQMYATIDKLEHDAIDSTISTDELTLIGRLTLQIAIYTAFIGVQPALALGYLDEVEALNFTLAFTANPRVEEQAARQRIGALVEDLPTATDYQLCAALQARRITAPQQ